MMSATNIVLSFEKVFLTCKSTDVWLNPSYYQTTKEILQEDERYGLFSAFKNHRVYNNTKLQNGVSGNAYWEMGVVRPDIVLRQNNKTYIIDTKWKRPQKHTASVSDLRQMYAYCRFWDAEKTMLLYPGETSENKFKSYLTDDYSIENEMVSEINHQCKMGFVSVLDEEGNLRNNIATDILKLLDFK